MGEVVGAGLTAHVPTIVLAEDIRRELNNGDDTTLVAGLQQLRKDVFETLDYDTVVVLDDTGCPIIEVDDQFECTYPPPAWTCPAYNMPTTTGSTASR